MEGAQGCTVSWGKWLQSLWKVVRSILVRGTATKDSRFTFSQPRCPQYSFAVLLLALTLILFFIDSWIKFPKIHAQPKHPKVILFETSSFQEVIYLLWDLKCSRIEGRMELKSDSSNKRCRNTQVSVPRENKGQRVKTEAIYL